MQIWKKKKVPFHPHMLLLHIHIISGNVKLPQHKRNYILLKLISQSIVYKFNKRYEIVEITTRHHSYFTSYTLTKKRKTQNTSSLKKLDIMIITLICATITHMHAYGILSYIKSQIEQNKNLC